MKIGFFIDIKDSKNFDYSSLDNGNPGIGGSEYMMISLTKDLSRCSKFNIINFSFHEIKIKNIKNIILNDLK